MDISLNHNSKYIFSYFSYSSQIVGENCRIVCFKYKNRFQRIYQSRDCNGVYSLD